MNPVICNICSKTFADNNSLKRHIKKDICKNIIINKIKCEYCSQYYSNKYNLKRHLMKCKKYKEIKKKQEYDIQEIQEIKDRNKYLESENKTLKKKLETHLKICEEFRILKERSKIYDECKILQGEEILKLKDEVSDLRKKLLSKYENFQTALSNKMVRGNSYITTNNYNIVINNFDTCHKQILPNEVFDILNSNIDLSLEFHENNKRKIAAFNKSNQQILNRMYGHIQSSELPIKIINERKNKLSYCNGKEWINDQEGKYVSGKIINNMTVLYKSTLKDHTYLTEKEACKIVLTNKIINELIIFINEDVYKNKIVPLIKNLINSNKSKIITKKIIKTKKIKKLYIKDNEFLEKEKFNDDEFEDRQYIKGIDITPILNIIPKETFEQKFYLNDKDGYGGSNFDNFFTKKTDKLNTIAITASGLHIKIGKEGFFGEEIQKKYLNMTESEKTIEKSKIKNNYLELIKECN